MTLTIRPESPADYADIAALNVRAFGSRSSEAVIVSLLRHHRAYTPDLALVAEVDGQVAGHAMFVPYTIRLIGQDVQAVNLAPLAVDVPFQGRGIGGALLEAGHAAARDRGYGLSFLLGHKTYYPRFGYLTRAYGASSMGMMVSGPAPDDLEVRTPLQEDLPALHDLWRREEGAVDFSLRPGGDLLDWLSPVPSNQASVYLHRGEIIGYTRGRKEAPRRPQMFLARDADSAHRIVHYLSPNSEIVLPLHPASASSAAFPSASCDAWEAAMVCPLAPSPFDEYYALVSSGQRPPGRPIWPPTFDVD